MAAVLAPATLVNLQHSIPPQIVRLTGITTAMVGNAPTIDAVLPMFFEFAGDSVLVATTLSDNGFPPPRGGAISPGPNHRQQYSDAAGSAGAEPRRSP